MGRSCSMTDYCAAEPCQNNGSCASEQEGYICHCHAGYDGKNCERDMDECAFNLCPARSVCYDNAGGFTCVWKDNRRRRSLLNEKLVYTIKLPFTSDGMKAMWNTDLLREKLNKCTGKRKLVLRPLRLTVVTREHSIYLRYSALCQL